MARQGSPTPMTTKIYIQQLVVDHGISRRRAAVLADCHRNTVNKLTKSAKRS